MLGLRSGVLDAVIDLGAGIIPTVGVMLIFWFVIRLLINADRNERISLARYEAEQDRQAREQSDAAGSDSGAA